MHHYLNVYRSVTEDSVKSAIDQKRNELVFSHDVYINLYNFLYSFNGRDLPVDFVDLLRSAPFFTSLTVEFKSEPTDHLVISNGQHSATFFFPKGEGFTLSMFVHSYAVFLDRANVALGADELPVDVKEFSDRWNWALDELGILYEKALTLGIGAAFLRNGIKP